jgi:hypothetical protein
LGPGETGPVVFRTPRQCDRKLFFESGRTTAKETESLTVEIRRDNAGYVVGTMRR